METQQENIEEPNKAEFNRQPDGTFGPGNLANPEGRPKGKTLKEWARDKLMGMTEEQREEFIKSLSKDTFWRMAEGNPHQTTDITSAGKPIPILNALPDNDISKEDSETEKKD